MDSPLEVLRRALEEGDLGEARAAMESLRHATHQANQLAAEVLHELRQPLLGIKAYAQMMEESAQPGTPMALLLVQVERMEQIISDFTRIASDKPAPRELLSLAVPVQNAVRLFQLNPDSARISLEVDAGDAQVLGNARLLEQLVLNLLNNARDALGGRGRIKVLALRDHGLPALLVADWGPGIPAELRDRIFDPYVTGKTRGSGLGLSVCRRIALEHGAQIHLAPPAAIPDLPPPATVFRVLFSPATEAPAARKRLLVVDDESIIRMVFKDLMGKECDVIEAQTAEEAIELLRAGPYDLIVTDKNLPGLSGLDLAQEARRADPNSRVILMTGYPSLVTAQQAVELGVTDYLLKPFDEIREVREKIRSALAAPPTTGAPRSPGRRVDVYEDNPASARQISEALRMLGLEPNVLSDPAPPENHPDAPAGLVVSWDFAPAHGKRAVELGRTLSRGAPFVVLAEHLTMDAALESLRGGASACLAKLTADVRTLSRELQRALKLSSPPT